MPFVINGSKRGGRALAVAIAAGLLTAAPAAAAPPVPVGPKKALKRAAANPESCRPDHKVLNPFAAWKDTANYALAPGGDFETGASGWTLDGAAQVVGENQPFDIGVAKGGSSLALSDGGKAVSAPMCIDATYPHFRLFARNAGENSGMLGVDVLYVNKAGQIVKVRAGDVKTRAEEWLPSKELKIDVTFDANVAYGAAPVLFRFSADGARSNWRVDDVYVDPFARR